MTVSDWTSPEGRAELRRLLGRQGARRDVIAVETVIPLLDALEAAERERDEAQKREPTQTEGDAHEGNEPARTKGECFVTGGGWTGRRCRVCGCWVWGGPTACVRCVEREERDEARAEAAAEARAVALIPRDALLDGAYHRERSADRGVKLAEARRDLVAAQARAATLREALKEHIAVYGGPHCHPDDCDRVDCIEHRADRLVSAALALPADRTALDAMLAEARREGARACVEAARRSHEDLDHRADVPDVMHHGIRRIREAVERAAAELDATKGQP